ncbi:MAG TPA: class A beta-lactamase-related serine hydrolase, partial [Candidatus Omnitrophota bacterium]|nr:class A beta-lactamase-related serine hydrolase [Candidatus Omnitrophota bacterium]
YLVSEFRAIHADARQSAYLSDKRRGAWLDLKKNLARRVTGFDGEIGVVIKDLGINKELTFHKDRLLPSASIVKIPIMAACFLAADQGKIRLDQEVRLKASDKLSGSGMLKDMPAGSSYSVNRLINLMISDSDNTATNMLTTLLGMDYLNKAFAGFGLKNTRLSRRVADYRSRNNGTENYTNAADIGMILEKIYRGTLGNKEISDNCLKTLKLTRTNDRIPRYLPADISVAHKTGLENGICHDAGIVFTKKGDFLIVVLTKHKNPDSAASKEFIAKLSLDAYKYFEKL